MEQSTTKQDPKQQIAVQAFLLWESEGCQPGRDLEYWMRAKEIVGQRAQTMEHLTTPENQEDKKSTESRRKENGREPAKRQRKTAGALVE